MNPMVQQSIAGAGALGGGYYGAQAGGTIGIGVGALLGLLAASILARSRSGFVNRAVASLSGEDNANAQLGLLAGATLGGGLGSLGGAMLGGYGGHSAAKALAARLGKPE